MLTVLTTVTVVCTVAALTSVVTVVDSRNDGLLKTPPMGWLSWEMFACQTKCNSAKKLSYCVSERLFTQIADALLSKGYKDAGYDRVNIDDCWMSTSRDVVDGRLLPDQKRFPHGIEFLANYMHQRGLKLGIYQNLGKKTCMGYPGLMGHMETDAKTFADWQVDMIKLDACFTPTTKLDQGYVDFGRLISRTGRPMVYSCSWPYYQVHVSQTHIIPNWNLISLNCHLFRVYHDIHPKWSSILQTIDFMADNQAIFRSITGHGSWPDPDMLLVGHPGLSVSQAQAQMAVWCILPAPLFMSNDPRHIDDRFEAILLNRDAIAINQDSLAKPGERIFHNKTLDLWRRKLANETMAIVVLNRERGKSLNIQIPLQQIVPSQQWNNSASIEVFDVFRKSNSLLKLDQDKLNWIETTVKPTGVSFLRLRIIK